MFPIDYTLPPDLIAQEPCESRDHARLLVVHRRDQVLEHRRFHELAELLRPGDMLVLNDTRVVPARLLGQRQRTSGKWEGLFLRELPDATWEMLCQTRGTLQEGEIIETRRQVSKRAEGELKLELVKRLPGGRWQVKPLTPGTTIDLLNHVGHIPLPPYIRKGAATETDRERYQTIYAQHAGAVAAPTAGLHFTQRVFEQLKQRGITWSHVTLHVGLGTFQPIQADDYTQHPMHSEWGQLPLETANAIRECKRRGSRVIAVGTTSVRVLESAWRQDSELGEWSGDTNLFIRPPYDFKVIDGLITNFHLPRTTLLLLVAAFAGVELTKQAYAAAIAERYRFYSYGDAMLIL